MKTAENASLSSPGCPMPKLDFDVITMGHGSGGVLTHRLLNAGVFSLLKNDYLNQQHDGALLDVSGPLAFTTDSYVISPIFFPGGDIGELAVNGSVNDLAMCGAVPKFLSLGFILEEGLRMDEFWRILVSIKNASTKAGVQIVTGDTKVVEKGKGDKIFINTSGIGQVHPNASIHINRIEPGDKIVVSGNVGSHGMAILSLREGLKFETTLRSDTACLNHTINALLDEYGQAIHFLRDPTRGGVATVLNEITHQSKRGVNIVQDEVPILNEVEGACEMLGLDPLYVANEGIFIAVVQAGITGRFLGSLKALQCTEAAVIGEITDQHPGQVVMQNRVGGRRVLNYLTGEQLPRIC